jgi:hypothetical protein
MKMATSKSRLFDEFDNLRKRLFEVEGQIEETLGDAADEAARRMRKLLGPEPVDEAQREALIRALAELKARNRGDGQAIAHWLEAEEEIDLVLALLGLREGD